MDNTTFMDSLGHLVKHSTMKDEHQLIKITEKTPMPKNIGRIVCGETNSNILTFEINRFYDGVDLYTKRIKIIVRNELGLFTEDAVNLQYNSELLRFSWILSDAVTCKSGTVTAAIAFIGSENGYKYAYKSLPFTIKVESSLDLDLDLNLDPDLDPPDTEPDPPYKNWFTDVECRLLELEQEPSFTQAETRVNLASGEKIPVLFGKIMKWFSDLKAVAFSGKFTDLVIDDADRGARDRLGLTKLYDYADPDAVDGAMTNSLATSYFDTCMKRNAGNEPDATDTYALGSASRRWSGIYARKIAGDEISCADHTGTQLQLGVTSAQDLTGAGSTNVAIFYKDSVFGAGIGRALDGYDGPDNHRITNQVVIGHYNSSCAGGSTAGGTNGIAFLIGNGTEGMRSNAMYVDYSGNSHIAGTQFLNGADYAEYLEWKDRNTNREDRVGRFVTLSGDKIAIANANDFIIGIVSGNPSVIGNDDFNAWSGRYQRDAFDRLILGDITTVDAETGKEIILHGQPQRNPLYDAGLVYIPRSERAEWDAVGMLGIMKVFDDGTCVEDGYCKVSDHGIATAALPGEDSLLTPVFKVMKRVSAGIIEVFFR